MNQLKKILMIDQLGETGDDSNNFYFVIISRHKKFQFQNNKYVIIKHIW